MSRTTFSAGLIAALTADHTRARYFAEFEFDGGTERLWTGLGTATALGQSWEGVGSLASIDGLEEGIELSPYALKLGLSRLDSTYANLAINEDYHNRPVRLYLGAIDDAGDLVTPALVFSGEMIDVEATVASDDGDVIMLTCENELARLDRSANLRYTDTQLQADHSGDLGLEYLAQIADHQAEWRGTTTAIGERGNAADGNFRSTDGRYDL